MADQQPSAHSQPNSQNDHKDKLPLLFYYNIRGLCQPIRNILYHLNIPYRNVKTSRKDDEKDNKKDSVYDNLFDSGLPIFQNQQLKISNCIAIAVYVCQRYGAGQLLGQDVKTRAKINEILFKYSLDMNKIMPAIMDIVVKSSGLEANQKKAYIQQGLKKLISQSRFLSFCLKQHVKTSKWILETLTIIDFYFYQTCFYVCGFFLTIILDSPELIPFHSFLQFFDELGLTKIQKNKQQQLGVFLQFKNEKMQEIVTQTWNGDRNLLIV